MWKFHLYFPMENGYILFVFQYLWLWTYDFSRVSFIISILLTGWRLLCLIISVTGVLVIDNWPNHVGLCRWIVISISTLAMRLALFPISVVQLKKLRRIGTLLPKCECSWSADIHLSFYLWKSLFPLSLGVELKWWWKNYRKKKTSLPF